MSEVTIDKVPYISLCDIKFMLNGKNTCNLSVDSSASKDSKPPMALNRSIPFGSVSSWENTPRKCKQKLNVKEESSDEEENKPVKKRIRRVVPKRNKVSESDDSSSSEKFDHSSDGKSSKSKRYSKSESESESSDEKTPYEKMIEKKRAEHKALFQELKLNEIKAELKEAVRDLKQKSKPASIKYQRKVYERVHRSKRVTNVDPYLSEQALSQKAWKEAALKPTIKKVPRIPSTQSFKEALFYEKSFRGRRKNIICLKVKSDQKFCLYDESALKALTLKSSNSARIVPTSISAASWCPVEKLIIAAGDTNGNYAIWNVKSESKPNWFRFRVHTLEVTCMQFSPYNHSQVISSSYDGTLQCCDVVKQMFTQVYDMFPAVGCTYFDFLSETTYIVSQTNGEVVLVDKRSRKTNEKKHQCHHSIINSVSVHPVNKNVFVTANIGEIHFWDLRKLQKMPIFQITSPKKGGAGSAYFSPVSGNSLLATSFDGALCYSIYDTTKLTGPINCRAFTKYSYKPQYNSRRRFQATWLPNSDDTFVVGSWAKAQVFDHNMNIYHELTDKKLKGFSFVNVFHPFQSAFAFCNSLGKIFVYT